MSDTLPRAKRNEAIRAALLQWLAERSTLAFDLQIITQRLNRAGLLDFNAGDQEAAEAMTFLIGSKFAASKPHGLGSTLFYQVTAAGVLAHERGELQST